MKERKAEKWLLMIIEKAANRIYLFWVCDYYYIPY